MKYICAGWAFEEQKTRISPSFCDARGYGRMNGQLGCKTTIVAVDLGRSGSGGEGYLLRSLIRAGLQGAFPLRTVTDADLPAPKWDAAHIAWKMPPEALAGALAAQGPDRFL
ncbi:hypothetical protein [uncultured Shimia sp.]|uniref:hypothetical protein n=1 Tax=uncultured Shimia sp. TaxID=573152 RepID=UPI0026066761|nr:hypothetical protein [uncultured Shimia sp.]